MVTRSQKVRLGVFLTAAFVVVLVTVGITVYPKLLEVRDIYFVGFRDVSITGLQEGGSVKYQGFTVGYVRDIKIDSKDIRRVIVELSLDHGIPIREDTRAEITFLGITGLKLIELKGGSMEAKPLPPGSFIRPGVSLAESITGKAEVIAQKTEMVLNNLALLTDGDNRDKIMTMVDGISAAVNRLDRTLRDNRGSLDRIMANTEQVSGELSLAMRTTRSTMDNLQSLSRSDSLKQIVGNLAAITETLRQAELLRLIREIHTALEATNAMLQSAETTFSKTQSDLISSVESLKESAEYLNQFARMVSEDPSVLVRGSRPKNAPDYKLEK